MEVVNSLFTSVKYFVLRFLRIEIFLGTFSGLYHVQLASYFSIDILKKYFAGQLEGDAGKYSRLINRVI